LQAQISEHGAGILSGKQLDMLGVISDKLNISADDAAADPDADQDGFAG
jgi:hypothetical protein